ncbi:MAG: hypothetical protein ACO1SX_23090 [Actinomycetota bacterium]
MTQSPAMALGWQLWVRQRWAAVAILVYLTALSVACRQTFSAEWRDTLLMATVPLVLGVLFLVAAFAYPEGDALGRDSSFPPDQFLLPVRSIQLAFWPMFYGSLTAAISWLAFRQLILRPLGVPAPDIWPAAMAAAAVAVLQAHLWMPMPFPYLRVVLALAIIPGLLVAGVQAGNRGASAEALCAAYSAVVVGAFLVAVAGLNRARRGDSAAWPWPAQRPRARHSIVAADAGASCRGVFAGPRRAQLWFECRTGGLLLPLITFVIFTVLSLPLLWVRELTPIQQPALPGTFGGIQVNLWLKMQVGILWLPTMLAAVVGFGRRAYHAGRGDNALHPFLATRPLQASAFATVRVCAAGLSAGAAWLLSLAFVFAWLLAPARSGERTASLLLLLAEHATPETGLCVLFIVACLMLFTWLGMVHTMWADLSGRNLLIHGATIVPIFLIVTAVAAFVHSGLQPGDMAPQHRLLSPWVLTVFWWAVALKMAAIVGTAALLLRNRTGAVTRLALLLGCWLLAVGVSAAALRWMAESGGNSSPLAELLTITYLPICLFAATLRPRSSAQPRSSLASVCSSGPSAGSR